ncbi:MAG: CusA/CzcA family heavy metal efflux RND transporter, partial [Flavobacteriales bacterium]|nr:CusA/CzcA family heavy metal efflux RND transporter [Flavobacteriales bacterium]
GKRRIVVGFNVRGADVKTVVETIQAKLDDKLKLPEGYYTTYGGQFENLIEANKRLSVAVPVALGLILVLLYFTFKSIKQSLLIFTAIPLSAIGGIVALWLRDMPFSISAGVGFIALFGVAVLNGIVLIGYFNELKKQGMDNVYDRIKEGTKVRLRPVILTAAVASLGFLPMAISSSAGAEVQKPLATVVIGGLITATLLTLIVLPILYLYFEKGIKIKRKTMKNSAMLLAFLFSSLAINAQEKQKLSLNEALEMGLKNNLNIQAVTLETKMQSQLVKTAFELPKTEISGTFGQINTQAQDKNFQISQSFNPFQISAKRKLLQENSSASQNKLSVSKQEITFSIRQSWNTILYFEKQNALLEKQNELMQKFVKSATLKFQTGETSALEKTIAVAKQQELEQKIKQFKTQIAIEKSKLKTLLDLENDIEISDTTFVPMPFIAKMDSTLVKQNPVVQLANQQVKIAQANHKLEKSNLFPEFSVGYFLQSITGNQEVDGVTKYYNNSPQFQGFSVGLSLPMFMGSTINKSKAAKTNIEMEQKNANYINQQFKSHLEQQMEQLTTYQSLIDYYKNTAIPNADLIIKNATKSYLNGDISYVEYVQGIETATEILTNYNEAINNFNQTIIAIQYTINQ